MKLTRFQDIKQLTPDGQWECDYILTGMVRFIDELVSGKDMAVDQRLNIDPDFQRAHVWTESQQIAWIEFFLRGGKSGRVIYLNNPGWQRDFKGDFVLVDGKQRIQAATRFINNEIPAFGSLFCEYTDSLRIINPTMKINVNTLKTRAEVLQWYIDMNAGGTQHTDDEILKVRKLLELEHENSA